MNRKRSVPVWTEVGVVDRKVLVHEPPCLSWLTAEVVVQFVVVVFLADVEDPRRQKKADECADHNVPSWMRRNASTQWPQEGTQVCWQALHIASAYRSVDQIMIRIETDIDQYITL
jgi:hypothetical protein